MSVGYRAVQWSRHKRVYDGAVAGAVLACVAAYVGVASVVWRGEHAVGPEVLVIRATGACALVLLHVILCIGPLARLDARWLPVLYNRRHLGVATFVVAFVHAAVVVGYYHGFGVVSPLVSLLTSSGRWGSLSAFPFEALGAGALAVMFLMAATSHDFWLKNLGSAWWKALHMLVYPAYGLLVGHVALGALQSDRGAAGAGLVLLGAGIVGGLHVAAGWRERRVDAGVTPTREGDAEAWIDAGRAEEIPMDRARVVCAPGGERIAVFRHAGGVSAVTNVCAHQGGPLGEGRVIDGCVTCPWHGWQYRPGDGCSPPPFQEKIATYAVRVVDGRVRVSTRANAAGTAVEPARVGTERAEVSGG